MPYVCIPSTYGSSSITLQTVNFLLSSNNLYAYNVKEGGGQSPSTFL